MTDDLFKAPRLYVSADLRAGASVNLPETQGHYLKNVMRLHPDDDIRIFNGRDGEWHAKIDALDKKKTTLTLVSLTRPQPAPRRAVHLFFTPIKKARFDWLIEKAVELGVTDLYPVLSQHAEVRQINAGRMDAQIIEAAEQCERLDIPRLHHLVSMKEALGQWPEEIPLLMALERSGARPLSKSLPESGPLAFLIGPEGGFSAEERQWPETLPFLKPVSLGHDILRSETAACYMLVAANMMNL